MENYRPRKDTLLKVITVEPSHVEIEDDGHYYHTRCIPNNENPQAARLHPGDILLVKNVDPGGGAVAERVTQGHPDGCIYMLSAYRISPPPA